MNGINTGEPIADYPFTTLTPTLGVVRAFNDKTFVVADIPGLIEGASECKGLGIALLKSIERTSRLLHLVDAAGPALLGDEDPAAVFASYLAVRHELSSSSAELATRPELVALSNVDLPDDEARERLCAYFEQQGVTPLCLSSATGEGVQAVVEEMARRVCGVVREVAGEEGWLRLGKGITER